MAEALALHRAILGRSVPSSGFQVTVGGEAIGLATNTNDITG